MTQSRLLSAVEAVSNTAVGYATAIMTQLIVFPMFGIHIKLHENLVIGAIFTVISLIRGYVIRRFFNGLKFKDPNAPVDAPAPLSVIRKFDTMEECFDFGGQSSPRGHRRSSTMSSQTMYKRLFGTESLDEVLARSKHRVQEIAQR